MEFENLQIEVPLENETESQYYGVKVYEKKYTNKSKDFVVGFNPNSKEFLDRKARRAKRFGLKENEVKQIANIETDLDLFQDVDLEKLNWPVVPDEALEEMRPDAILLYGVNDMSTKDVFEYFKLFGPENLEWIDDVSCNVVWEDDSSMVRALDGMSKTYAALKQDRDKNRALRLTSTENTELIPGDIVIKVEEDENISPYDQAIPIEDDIDPKDVWRIGLSFGKNQLFLRPATIKDKKLPGAAERSEYYLKYGKNPNNTKKAPGVLSKSRKRKLEQMKTFADERFKNKVPDVKICDLAELKNEGLGHKMEVDDEEPSIKRPSVHPNLMTMIADRVEIEGLGFNGGESIHDRLGSSSTNRRNGTVHDRLGSSVYDRLGKRNDQKDARDDIQSTRDRNRNHPANNRYGYEDDEGNYHDIYRAEGIKTEETEDIKPYAEYDNEDDGEENISSPRLSKHHSERFNRTSSQRPSRNNTSLSSHTKEKSDLRNRLGKRNKGAREPSLDNGKENLCIEIKREPDIDFDDIDMDDNTDQFEF